MPAVEESYRRQKALLWAASGYDDYGRPKRDALSTELDVRWLYVKGRVVDPEGNNIQTDAQVVVAQEIVVGSLMWLGSLVDLAAELPGTGTGTDLIPTSNLYEVVKYEYTPDIKGREFRRMVHLRRFTDTIADSV